MIKAVCFDLDDTLIQKIHSVMFLCMVHGQLAPLQAIERLEATGGLNWINADYEKAKLLKGLPTNRLSPEFDRVIKPISRISEIIKALKDCHIQTLVITAGPEQVACLARKKWRLDAAYGSRYEVINGVFTGKIIEHLGTVGKVKPLAAYCQMNGFTAAECLAIGDGASDIPLFQYCSKSIALNAPKSVQEHASIKLDTNDLSDILQFINR